MKELTVLGDEIREKRLSLNLRMNDVAQKAGITRATLCSMEKGNGSCSIGSLFRVLNILNISFKLESEKNDIGRNRASRKNTLLDKKINRFVIMCVEQYAHFKNTSSALAYKRMNKEGIINDLIVDYEDLHGMSSEYLNDYIDTMLGGNN